MKKKAPISWCLEVAAAVDAGVKIEDIMHTLGVSRPTVERWIAGKSMPALAMREVGLGRILALLPKPK